MKKTTVELPEELMVAAKKRAAETGGTLRQLLERGLRQELRRPAPVSRRRRAIRWVTVPGDLAADLDLADRSATHEWVRRRR
jgi:hypothetical protein